jgi:cellulose synthase/poly-beta-1,6-N-acetylglucosamine synthase-like glycosyltransferase
MPDSTEKTLALILRIDAVFKNDKSLYEILFINSKAKKGVSGEIKKHAQNLPVHIVKGTDKIKNTESNVVALMGDIAHYPPEALPNMIALLTGRRSGIVVGMRNNRALTSFWNFIKSSLLTSPSKYTDKQISQSGLVLLKAASLGPLTTVSDLNITQKGILSRIVRAHTTISFYDLSKIQSVYIAAQEQYDSAIDTYEDKAAANHHAQIANKGSRFYLKGAEYVTHNTLTRERSAIERTTLLQRIIISLTLIILVVFAFISGKALIITIVSAVTVLYFCDLLFNLFLIYRSFKSYSEIVVADHALAADRAWPIYTILCPLYKEVLVIPQFIAAMEAIDYPREQLEVLLLLEQDDRESIAAIEVMKLPGYFKILIVPDSMPKTKPKACNYGLLRATGEYSVIYDAEDIPDTQQLKKAVVAFETSSKRIGCIQAKLNYYNWDQNLLTRLFTLEYSLWFNLILTGLQSIKAPIPLGGTSNHFRTKVLRQLGGWDPFNVTEDADLGIRLAKHGLKTAVLDSTTLEEANSNFGNWLRQRSRWIKGYMQTYLVHMRDLGEFGKNSSRIDMLTFQLVIGGKVLSTLINPILWIMTLTYFIFRDQVGPTIESLYLTPIFYIGAISLVIGNFMYLYYYMMGAAQQERPELIMYALFVPLYWIMMSIAAYFALRDLIVRPFHWHKTKHGLHLKNDSGEIA